MLYLVNKSPLMFGNLESVLRIAQPGEPILLYEDGVFAAVRGARSEPLVQRALATHPVYALDADLAARGLVALVEGIQVVSYDGFVELVEKHQVAPWL